MDKVIVAITTYNLKEYIKQAIDSVLMQKTNFEFSIIIADDCSTDGTIDILKTYQEKYPDKIKVLFADKNMGSLANSNRIFEKLDCEYFSFLDGDDYWIGEYRLQRQVDFLDKHPKYVICSGNTVYIKNNLENGNVVNQDKLNTSYNFESMLRNTIPFFHTSSMLMRNVIFCDGLPKEYKIAEHTFENCALRGEDFRRILHLEKGDMFALNDVVSAYRIHERGMWQGSTPTRRMLEGEISYNFYSKYFKDKYGDYFRKKRDQGYKDMIKVMIKENNFLESYELGQYDTFLFTELLRDMQNQKNK